MMTEITDCDGDEDDLYLHLHTKFHLPMHFYSMNETQTSSREAHVNVTNSLIKINFRIRTRNHSL